MKRRTALKYLGALAGTAAGGRLLAGCGKDRDPRVEQGITTIVTVCMENRSYDCYLGARALVGKPGDGLLATMANANLDGKSVPVFHAKTACVSDPPHGWELCRTQYDNGKNDGFVRAYQIESGKDVPPEVMGYMTGDELPVTWALADAGTVCDRWFSSVLGPTWPNRMYLHSAQSGGLMGNTLPKTGGLMWPSIYHRLNDAGVPWAYYYSNLPFVGLWNKLDTAGKMKRVDNEFFDDAEEGTLPPVVFVDPAFYVNDDHPPLPPVYGQQFLASIYGALAASPQWPNILLVVTYDEHGGFFDHVPPPQAPDESAAAGFGQLGFRVPALVLGPYAKQGAVSSVVYDHTSVLAHIEKTHKLPPLTMRDAAANTLDDAIDQARLAARDPADPITLPQVTVDPAQLGSACQKLKSLKAASELHQLADAGFFPPSLYRPRSERDILLGIAAQVERLGLGGLR